MNKGWGA
ncbi:hypothetical protein YPPY65_3117, partial [Yersinia pestis PY-65]